MVRLVFRPYTQLRRSICTSEPRRTSTRVSPGFVLTRYSSPSFGYQLLCSRYPPTRPAASSPRTGRRCRRAPRGTTVHTRPASDRGGPRAAAPELRSRRRAAARAASGRESRVAAASDCDGRSSWRVPGLRLPRALARGRVLRRGRRRLAADQRSTKWESARYPRPGRHPARKPRGCNVGRLPPLARPRQVPEPWPDEARAPQSPHPTRGPANGTARPRGGGTRRGHCRDPVRRETPQITQLCGGRPKCPEATDSPDDSTLHWSTCRRPPRPNAPESRDARRVRCIPAAARHGASGRGGDAGGGARTFRAGEGEEESSPPCQNTRPRAVRPPVATSPPALSLN